MGTYTIVYIQYTQSVCVYVCVCVGSIILRRNSSPHHSLWDWFISTFLRADSSRSRCERTSVQARAAHAHNTLRSTTYNMHTKGSHTEVWESCQWREGVHACAWVVETAKRHPPLQQSHRHVYSGLRPDGENFPTPAIIILLGWDKARTMWHNSSREQEWILQRLAEVSNVSEVVSTMLNKKISYFRPERQSCKAKKEEHK